ncbi:hypothetical protein IEQ44_07730 [Nocardioides sp. Y6]|uniref:Uncharacterized protein n=1 Tax=Nocardioides malaquae TaxID=2773426 RepID=A0ABR9RSJ0_9ACTN|nr:hypothetical protein [Nocardioides malaquae]MBE7324539.1 hypothetical protein [Nocardioides malaquae]
MNFDSAFVKQSLTIGGALLAAHIVLQVVLHLVMDQSFFAGGTPYFLAATIVNLLLWLGTLAALPGLVALGVAAARPER